MRYVFRTDASLEIGAGHLMRSSAIAEEMIARGLSTAFVGNISEMPWLRERIRNIGFKEIREEEEDFSPNARTDVLILDSYHIPINNHFIQQENWLAVVNIFDHFTPNYACNLRIHPGLEDGWPAQPNIHTLAGPRYIPMRKSISGKNHADVKEFLDIVVVGGGADAQGFVGAIANVLRQENGNFRASLITNQEIDFELDDRFSKISIGSDFDIIAHKADLVFSTASTTSLEFIARGCAVAVGCSVSNQETYYEKLSQLKVAIPIGKLSNNNWKLDAHLISELVYSQNLRINLRKNAENFIDFKGAERIVSVVAELAEAQIGPI